MRKLLNIKLKQLAEINLLAVFFVHFLGYLLFIKLWFFREDLLEYELFFTILRQVSDFTFLSLSLFYYIAKRDRWRYSLRFLLYCITALCINNFPYIVLKYETDLYYCISSSILYCFGVFVSLWVLTRR